jgi:type I restriction enzyme S subunit
MSYSGAIGRLITFAIGGGWGSEDEKDNYSKVAVIRGTDIPRVTNGDFSTVPFRYEDDKKIANRKLNVGDIVLETAGGSSANGQFTGRTLLVTEEVLEKLGTTICASFCKRLEVDKNLVNPGYFYHYMQDLYKSGRVASYDSQSTGISNFQFDVFKTTEHLDLGSMKHQEQVSSLLSGIQNQINLNSQISKTLEDIAQTIFKSWFIDFDPVKAKMAGEKPVGMDEATAALFPDSMEDSELGLIPSGWFAGNLADVFSLQGGYSFKSSSWAERGVPVVKIGSVKPGLVDLNQVSYISQELAANVSSSFKLESGSLVIGLTGYVGQVGLVRTHFPAPLLNQRVARFGGVDGEWRVPFTYCLTRRLEFKKAVENAAIGSAQQNVSIAQILGLPHAVPPFAARAQFDDLFENSFRKIIALADENEILGQLRDALLPRLISGELQIPEEMLAS